MFNDIEKLSMLPDKSRVHFMSTIVCNEKEEREEIGSDFLEVLEVVDGQQRLTTLVILLKTISIYLNQNYKKKYQNEIEYIEGVLLKDNKRLLLLLNDSDSSIIYRNYITDSIVPNEVFTPKTCAEQNFIDAFNDCRKFVKKCDEKMGILNQYDGIMELLKIIKNRLYFLLHKIEDESSVYTLFEVLNSRGLEVDWLDKCKSIIMGIIFERRGDSAAREDILEVQKYWKLIYSTIGVNDLSGSEILRYATTLNYGKECKRLLNEEDSISFIRQYCYQT